MRIGAAVVLPMWPCGRVSPERQSQRQNDLRRSRANHGPQQYRCNRDRTFEREQLLQGFHSTSSRNANRGLRRHVAGSGVSTSPRHVRTGRSVSSHAARLTRCKLTATGGRQGGKQRDNIPAARGVGDVVRGARGPGPGDIFWVSGGSRT